MFLRFCFFLSGKKFANSCIHCWVEHLMLERLVCNTYCVKLHRSEGNRFSVVHIQIFGLSVTSHLAGFFKA